MLAWRQTQGMNSLSKLGDSPSLHAGFCYNPTPALPKSLYAVLSQVLLPLSVSKWPPPSDLQFLDIMAIDAAARLGFDAVL